MYNVHSVQCTLCTYPYIRVQNITFLAETDLFNLKGVCDKIPPPPFDTANHLEPCYTEENISLFTFLYCRFIQPKILAPSMSEYYRVFELCNRKSRQNPKLFQSDYQIPDGNDLRDKWGPKSRDAIPTPLCFIQNLSNWYLFLNNLFENSLILLDNAGLDKVCMIFSAFFSLAKFIQNY